MKKIPTMFERVYENHKVIGITDKVTPGCEEIAAGKGFPTVKIDGSCCAFIDGKLYKRYDAKKGKKPPEGAIPCCDPDPVTGHWPHWVRVNPDNPGDKWYWEACLNCTMLPPYGIGGIFTYEAVGPHFQGNPYELEKDTLLPHAAEVIRDLVFDHSFEAIREYLSTHEIEGIVFWRNGGPVCKIKRTDFGLQWPVK